MVSPHDISKEPATVGAVIGIAAAAVAVRVPGAPWWFNLSTMLVLAAAIYVGIRLPHAFTGIRINGVDVLLCVFVTLRIFTEVFDAWTLNAPVALSSIIDWLVILLAYFLIRAVISDADDAYRVLAGLLMPSIFVAGIAVLQIIDVPHVTGLLAEHTASDGLNNRLQKGWDIRATSTIGHWTALGGYLVCQTAVNCALILRAVATDRRVPWSLLLTLVALLMGVLSTLTFAPIFSSIAIVSICLVLMGARAATRVLVVAAPAAMLSLFLWPAISARLQKQIGEEGRSTDEFSWLPESVAFRAAVWVHETIPSAFERPLFGWGSGVYGRIGLDNSPIQLIWGSPESEWFRTLVTGGILLLGVELILVFCVGGVLWRSTRHVGTWVSPILVGFCCVVLMSFVHSHLTNRGVPLLLWPIIAALLSAKREKPGVVQEVYSKTVIGSIEERADGEGFGTPSVASNDGITYGD